MERNLKVAGLVHRVAPGTVSQCEGDLEWETSDAIHLTLNEFTTRFIYPYTGLCLN